MAGHNSNHLCGSNHLKQLGVGEWTDCGCPFGYCQKVLDSEGRLIIFTIAGGMNGMKTEKVWLTVSGDYNVNSDGERQGRTAALRGAIVEAIVCAPVG